MPKLYIALATYNGEKYLPWMLDSLLLQTRPADKVFAVDDGSTDGTVAILERYKNRLPLDIHPQKENRGHRAAFNLALELVQKEAAPEDFIALADQDDVWLPEKLKILSEKIGNADLIFGDAEVIGKDGEKIADSWRTCGKILPHLPMKALLTGFTNVTGCLTLFKASLLQRVLPFPEGIPVHDQWITFCASIGNGCISTSEKVVKYRIHENNSIGLGERYCWSDRLKLNLKWIQTVMRSKVFQDLHPEEKAFAVEYERYISSRFIKNFQMNAIPWAWKNRTALYPQCSSFKDLLSRSLFAAVGVKFAQRFLGRT
jgi:glycosyltransferase involved in cell wall biosynthesis